MIPIADSPRDPKHAPWVTLLLIALNLVVGAVTLPLDLIEWTPEMPGYLRVVHDLPHAYTGSVTGLTWATYTFGFRPLDPGVTTTVSAMFLHAGWIHLLGNMLYLWIYGPNVEQRLGRSGFLSLYLAAGASGTLLFALFSSGSTVPVVGASGAVSGLLGAYLVFFPLHTIRVLVLFVTTFRLPAWSVIAIFVVFDNLWPVLAGVHTGIAHTAHLGGFVGGVGVAVVLRLIQGGPARDPMERVDGLVAQGMWVDAHRVLCTLAASRSPEVAAAAEGRLHTLEADPRYQHAMVGHGRAWSDCSPP